MAVLLSLEANEPQRRITVAFRLVLVIPHLVFASVLSVVAFVVVVFAWFAVLFTAHLPAGMGDFLRRILQYQARVHAYGYFLLTDLYPPFDVGPRDYPAMLELDEPGRFNRAAVLFRFWLQLPALVVSQLATAGALVTMFVVWLVTLVNARVPPTAHLAMACILRYQMRTYAYIGMLTSEYPGGLFGDRDDDIGAPGALDTLPSSPRATRLVLSGGGKALVAIALLVGTVGQIVNTATTGWSFRFGDAAEIADLDDDFQDGFDEWSERSRDCTRAELSSCQQEANADLRAQLQRYRRDLSDFDADEESAPVIESLLEIERLLGRMSEAPADERLRLFFLVQDAKDVYDDRIDDLLAAVTFG